eukprot:m.10792 g.10792  ORF g.10792 m.10792 type:complete len:873 (-) comp6701_c0_seq1:83-2701(-)
MNFNFNKCLCVVHTAVKRNTTLFVKNTARALSSAYSPVDVEEKWKDAVLQKSPPLANSGADKFYALSMFPYPSGKLHMGHVRVYTISDTISRFNQMCGKSVLHPMGWDAFGLPAENAAIERNLDPAQWTKSNILEMRSQLDAIGTAFDWDREIITCDPSYYKDTQRVFLELFKRGLVYQKEAVVNWDPVDKTVLANEQVDADGRSWRSGAVVEKRKLKQWFLKITDYAEELLEGLDELNWPEHVKTMQREWIGKQDGYFFNYNVINVDDWNDVQDKLTAFTTSPHTIFGHNFVAVSPQHRLAQRLTEDQLAELEGAAESGEYCAYHIEGIVAPHPITGSGLPIFAAAYVKDDYGTGVVMGVPGHDDRDRELAEKNDIRVFSVLGENSEGETVLKFSGNFKEQTIEEGTKNIMLLAEEFGFGGKMTSYRLRDWLISRQRYWGTPIPVIHCEKCGIVPEEEENLPVSLPSDVDFHSDSSPLASCDEFVNIPCPSCKGSAKRETDTMDTFVDSSWYFQKFLGDENALSAEKNMLPVDLYIGGVEHAVLHLLYARFITKALADSGMSSVREPFHQLLVQGMVLGECAKSSDTGAYLLKDEWTRSADGVSGVENETNAPVEITWEKMSKSKHNGTDPTDAIKTYGVDVMRLATLFQAPPSKELMWGEGHPLGSERFMKKLFETVSDVVENYNAAGNVDVNIAKTVRSEAHKCLNHITDVYSRTYGLNTAVSSLMSLHNIMRENKTAAMNSEEFIESLRILLVCLAPMAPFAPCELWERMRALPSTGFSVENNVLSQQWPKVDQEALVDDVVSVVVQVGGKTRGEVVLSSSQAEDEECLRDAVLASDIGKKWIGSNDNISKFIVPKGQNIVSVVVNNK